MIRLPEQIIDLAKLFGQDTPLYLVGGVVRNALLDLPLSDFDICSSATADEVKGYLAGSEYRITAEYARTGTLVIEWRGGKAEYTTFREDSYPLSSGHHSPNAVIFTRDIHIDARRRDFTCNALYYDILRGEIIDLVGGQQDIRDKVLRSVGDNTLSEDALRIMRLVRFSCQLGFEIAPRAMASAKSHASGLADISAERIHDELVAILNAPEKYHASWKDGRSVLPSDGIRILVEIGAMRYIIPELLDGIGMEQNPKYHKYTVYEHILHTLDNCPPAIRMAGIMHDIAKPVLYRQQGNMHGHDQAGVAMAREIMSRLKFSNRDIELTTRLVGAHMFNLDNKATDSTIRQFVVANWDILPEYIELRRADGKASRPEVFDESSIDRILAQREYILNSNIPIRIKDMDINGKDLGELGYRGKDIGEKLQELFVGQVAEGKRYTREQLLDILRR